MPPPFPLPTLFEVWDLIHSYRSHFEKIKGGGHVGRAFVFALVNKGGFQGK